MRKITFILIISMVVCIINLPVYAASPSETPNISVTINGERITLDQPIIGLSGRTLLPLRSLLNKLGVPNDDQHIIWNNIDKSVTIVKDSTIVYLKVGSNKATVDGREILLDVPPLNYKNGRTYIPIRFVSEALAKKVEWESVAGAVMIMDSSRYEENKRLLTEVSDSHNLVRKAELLSVMQLKLSKSGSDIITTAELDNKCDKDTNRMLSILKVPVFSQNLEFRTFYTNTEKCNYDPVKDEWAKEGITQADFDKAVNSNINPLLLGKAEIMYAGLTEVQSENSGEMILKGAFAPEGFAKLMTSYANLGKYKIDSCSTELTIDSSSSLVKKVAIDITGKVTGTGGTYAMTAHIEGQYKVLDQAYVIEPPEDLKID